MNTTELFLIASFFLAFVLCPTHIKREAGSFINDARSDNMPKVCKYVSRANIQFAKNYFKNEKTKTKLYLVIFIATCFLALMIFELFNLETENDDDDDVNAPEELEEIEEVEELEENDKKKNVINKKKEKKVQKKVDLNDPNVNNIFKTPDKELNTEETKKEIENTIGDTNTATATQNDNKENENENK